jgi:hypothetical protein
LKHKIINEEEEEEKAEKEGTMKTNKIESESDTLNYKM